MTDATPGGRYAGRPMTRVLDAYVLDAIGVLDDSTATELTGMRATLASALGVEADTWQGVVEQAMAMPAGAADELRKLWAFTSVSAEAEGGSADPLAFAHDIVDATFGDGTDTTPTAE